MDIEMPEMAGREATRRIRAAGVRVPIVALSAHYADQPGARPEPGFDGVLPKPVDRKTLLETCAEHMAQAHALC